MLSAGCSVLSWWDKKFMSTTLYISFDREVPGLEPNAEDKVFLAQLVGDSDAMDALARQLGTPSLSSFQSYVADDLSDLVDDPDDPQMQEMLADADQKVEWFDPSEALPAVRALAAHYAKARYIQQGGRRKAGKSEDVDRTDDLLAELKHTEQVLTAAAQHGARYRFHIGF